MKLIHNSEKTSIVDLKLPIVPFINESYSLKYIKEKAKKQKTF
jgi:hypothetical protein